MDKVYRGGGGGICGRRWTRYIGETDEVLMGRERVFRGGGGGI